MEPRHLADEEVIRFADGELRSDDIRDHLEQCEACRLRLRQFEDAAREFDRLHRDSQFRSGEGPRALFRARLREEPPPAPRGQMRNIVYAAATVALAIGWWVAAPPGDSKGVPRPDLTPGAVRNVALSDVCSSPLASNADVVPAIQRAVFAEYGVSGTQTGAYEVDYLITPALGGSSDIKNLWPQPYSGSVWNAYIKDALEDHLRGMVCSGELDLATAQHEIAGNWIAAYKKYFHTDRPLPVHTRSQE